MKYPTVRCYKKSLGSSENTVCNGSVIWNAERVD